MFETTFFFVVVGAFAVRTNANASPVQTKSTAEQQTTIRDLCSTAGSSLQGEPFDV
jgi:hypothetical protein